MLDCQGAFRFAVVPPDGVGDAVDPAAATAALKGAKPQKYNAFKIELARRTIVRALTVVAGMA